LCWLCVGVWLWVCVCVVGVWVCVSLFVCGVCVCVCLTNPQVVDAGACHFDSNFRMVMEYAGP